MRVMIDDFEKFDESYLAERNNQRLLTWCTDQLISDQQTCHSDDKQRHFEKHGLKLQTTNCTNTQIKYTNVLISS